MSKRKFLSWCQGGGCHELSDGVDSRLYGHGNPFSWQNLDEAPKLPAWKKTLDGLNIGFDKSLNYNLLVGLPFNLSRQEYERLQRFGVLITQMFHIANKLYSDSLGRPNIVTELVEGGMKESEIKLQRFLYERQGGFKPPLFMRADMLSPDKVVEVQCISDGLGLMHSIRAVTSKMGNFGVGLVKGWAEGLKKLTGKEKPRLALVAGASNWREYEYFANALRPYGVKAVVYPNEGELPKPSEVDVLERAKLSSLMASKGFHDILKAYLKGEVLIEPPPTTIYDSKIAMLLAFHLETRRHFPSEIRSMFPETWSVASGTKITLWDGEKLRDIEVEQIADLTESERRLVLKYSGSGGNWAGGSGVFQLDGGRQRAAHLLSNALIDHSTKHEPWMIQDRMRVKYEITHLTQEGSVETAQMHARIMPYYRTVQGKTELIGGSALFSRDWKVHGNSKSVHCAIEVA